MRVFEILKGTNDYDAIESVFTWSKPFMDNIDELSELLGFDAREDVGVNDWCLVVRKIPSGFEDQFKKNPRDGWFLAKKKSVLNEKFLSFIAKHQIRRVGTLEVSMKYPSGTIDKYHRLFNRYFMSLVPKVSEKVMEVFIKEQCLKEIPEAEFLRLKADYLEHTGE